MKTVLVNVSAILIFLVLCPIIFVSVTAQNPDNSTNTNGNNNQYPYARFSPSMAVIIIILIAALFFMGFFSIYIRHCSDATEASGRARRGTSVRGRRAEAARGLDASVIESFPTFTYAEVKDHKIGKGALECAVCLNEFEEEETLRLLPKCDHVFHPECVDAWLASHVTCPVCRANLVPQAGDEAVPQIPESTVETEVNGGSVRRTGSSVSVVVQINDDQNDSQTTPRAQSQGKDNPSFDYRNRSIKLPRMLSFGRFRSHSTGHDSVVRPGENLDRFTLRLPADVRREVMHRAALNRTRSCAVTLPREGSSRRGYRSGGEGSSRTGRFFRRMDTLNRDAKSDRWVFFTRVFSMKSPRAAAEASGEGSKDGGSVGGRTAIKLPSFKCLEPSVGDGDEVRLISCEPARSSPV